MGYNREAFDIKRKLVFDTLVEMAAMSPGGGLYVKDIDCTGGVYSLNDIEMDEEGNVRLKAYMWEPNELAKKSGYFRED